jgi:pSer/pThr/pTyr-binding forkhead associated (FHA) protein
VNEEQTVIRRRQPIEGWASSELNAYLIVLSGRSVGKMFKVPVGEVNLGRALESEVRLEDEGVSRNHARMVRQEDGSVVLHDLGSTNGTYVNGERVSKARLPSHSTVSFHEEGPSVSLKIRYLEETQSLPSAADEERQG